MSFYLTDKSDLCICNSDVFVVTTYSDTRYLLLINTGAILESIIVAVIGARKGGFGYHGIEAAVVQIVVMIMVGAYSVLTTKVIRENTRKRFTEVAQEKQRLKIFWKKK